jgi:hypothetical protein
MSKSFFTRHKTGLAGLAAPGWFFRILWRRYRGKSWISTLWGFFAGQYLNLALAALVFVVKASPVWVWPVVTRNILNALSPVRPDSLDAIRVNILVMLVLILQNIPLHTLHVYYPTWSSSTAPQMKNVVVICSKMKCLQHASSPIPSAPNGCEAHFVPHLIPHLLGYASSTCLVDK